MHKSSIFLTELGRDWPNESLMELRSVLEEAGRATLARSDKVADPLLDTPNLPNLRGVIRWIMVDHHLYIAASNGRFPGITPHWVSLGGVHTLELHGKYTSVTPCHLLEPNESPRESAHRKTGRGLNQVSPLLAGFEDMEEGSEGGDRLHLLLVHGGRTEEFAYFRAYIDEKDRSVYRALSKNIRKMPMLVPTLDAFEEVPEPAVELKTADAEQRKAE
jgi:hypothetical protein